jgi:fructose-1,6-bisphosphatase/inositol monophosphatase family enzyme
MLKELERIAYLVRDAVRALPKDFDRGAEMYMGADGTPTSSIDKVAEDVIFKAVEDRGLEANLLSEEAGLVDRGFEDTLVIDPIDGTHNSILNVPMYSVSLAVGKRSLLGVEHAVLLDLVTGALYKASKGQGATIDGERMSVRSLRSARPATLLYLGRFVHPRTFEIVGRSSRVRAIGCASLEMCLVAQGRFDAYYFNTKVYEKGIRVVDIAASALMLREAGGEIVDLEGKVLDLPFDLAARSNFLAYGDAKTKELML